MKTKFIFGQLVEIKNDFYSDVTGNVIDHDHNPDRIPEQRHRYQVRLSSVIVPIDVWLWEYELDFSRVETRGVRF